MSDNKNKQYKEFDLLISGPKMVDVYEYKNEEKWLMNFKKNPSEFGLKTVHVIEKAAVDELVSALQNLYEASLSDAGLEDWEIKAGDTSAFGDAKQALSKFRGDDG